MANNPKIHIGFHLFVMDSDHWSILWEIAATAVVFILSGVRALARLLSILLYPPEASGGSFGLAFASPPPPRVERFSGLFYFTFLLDGSVV